MHQILMDMNKIETALERARDTKALIIGNGAVSRTAEMFSKLFSGQKAMIIADSNTWEVAGCDAQKSLDDNGIVSYEPEMIGVSRERFRKTVTYIPFMRSRFTNIDVIYRLGWMDEFLERMFGKGGVWEI